MAVPCLTDTEPGSPLADALDAVTRFGSSRPSLNDLLPRLHAARDELRARMEREGFDAETLLCILLEGIEVNGGYNVDDLFDLAALALLRAQDALAADRAGVLQ